MFIIISKELKVNGNICEILDIYFEPINIHRKIQEDEYDSQFDDYRDIKLKGKGKIVNDEPNTLTIHKKLQKTNLNNVMMDFDATSSYPTVMMDEKSVYPKIKTGFVFKHHMKDVYVKSFKAQNFNEDGDESANLKIKYYNPPNLMSQHLPVKEKVRIILVNILRNDYIIDTLTSVDIQEIDKSGGKVIQIHESLIYRENFKISPFKKVNEKLFTFRQKYKDEGNDLMQ